MLADTGACQQMAAILRAAKPHSVVFFGGAGVSTESGIPDFRGSGGLYQAGHTTDVPPETILHVRYFAKYPDRFYAYYRAHMLYPHARPHAAHYALSKLEAMGKLSAVITQNIDGLHQAAGSRHVFELHGSTLRNYCVDCGREYGLEAITATEEEVPHCSTCGGMIRPDVVLYGEPLDGQLWFAAEKAIRMADVMIVGGTSLTVMPAADMVTDFHGSHLIIINQTPTPYDHLAEMIIREPIGKVFCRVMDEMESNLTQK